MAAGLLSLITVVGCQDSTKPGSDGAPSTGGTAGDGTPTASSAGDHLVAGPSRSLQLIARTAVLGFRADGNTFRAGYTTHDVSVQDGFAELTPYSYDTTGARITGGNLGLETGAITREDGTVLTAGGAARTNSAGALEIARGAAVEVLSNREDGIEQAWQFADAPEGTGDLTVAVEVTGQNMVAANDSGLHFASSAGLGFRYSHAVWRDAASHEWPIQSEWKDGRISITVPGEILSETRFPATLDPTISAEAAIDTQVNGATGASTFAPAVAFDGTNFLVVWSDERLSRDDDIFATRVSQAGAILDAGGITIASVSGKQLHPAVAFAGTQYIVAWEDFKVTGGTESDIAVARVSTAGVVTTMGHVAASSANDITPKVAANGTNALIVWNSNNDVKASLFNGNAFGSGIAITSDALFQVGPTVTAKSGGNFLVAYSEGTTSTTDSNADLKGRFVTQAGVVSGAAFTISAGAGRQYDPTAAFDGTNYIVAWTNNNAGIDLFGTRVSTAGVVLDTRTEGVTPNVGGVGLAVVANSNQELSNVACTTGTCFLTWQDNRNRATPTASFDIFGELLTTSPALAVNGTAAVVSGSSGPQFTPAVAATPSGFFTVWQDERDVATQTIFGARITSAGAVTDGNGIMLVTGNNREATPAMGRVGTTFGVFWNDSRVFGSNIETIRFVGASQVDPSAVTVSGAQFAQESPAATKSSSSFFVVWQDGRNGVDRDIFGARLGLTGAVLDASGIAIATATGDQLVPKIASNGTVSLVVWEDRRSGNFDIFGAIVDNASGSVTARDIVICNATGDQGRPDVAFDSVSGQFLVVWADSRITSDSNIFGARVTTAGAVLDANGVSISSAANGQFTPAVSFLNGTALVAWEDRRTDSNGDIFGARVTIGSGLAVLDASGFTISGAATGQQNAPTVSALGGSFLVAWTDGRNAGTSGTDIFGQQIGASGALNGAAFAISTDTENEDSPQLSDTTSNVTRIAYTRLRPDLQTMRVETRTISVSAGTGQSCSTAAQCSTGFCVDSRCCDTACGGGNKTDCQACNNVATGQPDGTCSVIPGPNKTICRNYASTFCDLREYCDGVNPACPPDIGRNQGLVCNSTTMTVCPSNAAPGPHGCP